MGAGGEPGHVPGHIDRVVQAESVPVRGLGPVRVQALGDLTVNSLQTPRVNSSEYVSRDVI